jgi:hypothetical protein
MIARIAWLRLGLVETSLERYSKLLLNLSFLSATSANISTSHHHNSFNLANDIWCILIQCSHFIFNFFQISLVTAHIVLSVFHHHCFNHLSNVLNLRVLPCLIIVMKCLSKCYKYCGGCLWKTSEHLHFIRYLRGLSRVEHSSSTVKIWEQEKEENSKKRAPWKLSQLPFRSGEGRWKTSR